MTIEGQSRDTDEVESAEYRAGAAETLWRCDVSDVEAPEPAEEARARARVCPMFEGTSFEGLSHEWVPLGRVRVGQTCRYCDTYRLPATPAATLRMDVENALYYAEQRAVLRGEI